MPDDIDNHILDPNIKFAAAFNRTDGARESSLVKSETRKAGRTASELQQNPTMADVAEQAGVSTMTVSRALKKD